MKRWTCRGFKRLLKANDYTLVRSNGSHFVYHSRDGNTISINKDLNPMVAKRLIKENNLKEIKL